MKGSQALPGESCVVLSQCISGHSCPTLKIRHCELGDGPELPRPDIVIRWYVWGALGGSQAQLRRAQVFSGAAWGPGDGPGMARAGREGKQRRPGAYFPVPEAGRLVEAGRKSPPELVTPRGLAGAGLPMESRSELWGHLYACCRPAAQEPGSPAR